MTSSAVVDSLESSYSRKNVTSNRLSRQSNRKSRQQSFHKLHTLYTDTEKSLPVCQKLSVASVNATLGNASSLEENLSIVAKTPGDSPLFKTINEKQMQHKGLSRYPNVSKIKNTAGMSCSDLNSNSECKSKNNKKLRSCIPNICDSTSRNNIENSSEIDFENQNVETPVYKHTPPSRVLSSEKSIATPSLSGHKTPRNNPGSSYNDSPLSVKMLKSKHETLNALHNMFATNTSPQVSGISKLIHVVEEDANDTKKYSNQMQEVQDDLPRTRPVTALLMQGVIAFVDVRNGGDNRSEGVKSHLRELGATVLDKFTKEVTHVVFMDGLMSTYKKAVQRKIPLVSVLWIEACKEIMERVPESLYPPHQMEKYESPDPLKKFRRERSFQPNPDEKLEDWLEKCKLKRRKKRLIIDEKENKEIPLPEVLRNRPAWLDGNLEQALRSLADVGPEYDEYINRSTSPTLSEEQSFNAPLAVRLMRKIRHVEEASGQNAVTEKKSDASTPKERVYLELEEPGRSKEQQVVNLKTTSTDIARQSNCFSSKDTSFDNENESPVCSQTMDINLSKAIQQCVRNLTTSNVLAANKDLVVNGSKYSTAIRLKPSNNRSMKSKSKSESSEAYDSTQNIASELSKESSCMEVILDIKNKEIGLLETSTSDTTKLSCDVSVSSLSSSRARTKRKLLPLTQPEVLEGDVLENAAPPQCPYNLDTPKSRKRKKVKSIEVRKYPRRHNTPCSINVSPRTKASPRNSLDCFVLDGRKSKRDKANVVRSLPTMVATSLHTQERELIASVIEKLGGFALVPKVQSSTTHVVASGPKRTVNLLKGVVRGCWIITQEWISRSLEAEHWIEEEPFELTSFSPAVQENRVARLSFGHRYKNKIFKECGALYVSHLSKPPKVDLEELIKLCGGKVVKSVHRASLVVGKGLQKKHPCCIQELWILDSITCNKPKPLDCYLLESPKFQ